MIQRSRFQSLAARTAVITCSLLGGLGSTWAATIGAPLTAPIQVLQADESPALVFEFPTVARDGNDNLAVVWSAGLGSNGGGIGSPLLGRLLASDGSPTSPSLQLVPRDARNSTEGTPLSLAVNRVGQFATTYTSSTVGSFRSSTVFARTFAADGTPIATIEVAQTPADLGDRIFETVVGPAIAINASGEIVVTWITHITSGSGVQPPPLVGIGSSTLLARRFRLDGTPIGNTRIVARRTLPSTFGGLEYISSNVRIAMSDNGDYAVAYSLRRPLFQVNSPFEAQLFRANGTSVVLPTRFVLTGDRTPLVGFVDYALSFSADGDLFFAWTTPDRLAIPSQGPTTDDIWLARYAARGGAVSPQGTVAFVAQRESQGGGNLTLNVSPTPSGGAAITWPTGNRNEPDLAFGRYFDSRLQPLTEPFVVAESAGPVHSTTDSRGNLIVAYGKVMVRKFQGP